MWAARTEIKVCNLLGNGLMVGVIGGFQLKEIFNQDVRFSK